MKTVHGERESALTKKRESQYRPLENKTTNRNSNQIVVSFLDCLPVLNLHAIHQCSIDSE